MSFGVQCHDSHCKHSLSLIVKVQSKSPDRAAEGALWGDYSGVEQGSWWGSTQLIYKPRKSVRVRMGTGGTTVAPRVVETINFPNLHFEKFGNLSYREHQRCVSAHTLQFDSTHEHYQTWQYELNRTIGDGVRDHSLFLKISKMQVWQFQQPQVPL